MSQGDEVTLKKQSLAEKQESACRKSFFHDDVILLNGLKLHYYPVLHIPQNIDMYGVT